MKRVRVNGLEFAYLERGDGPLVLLLHGFPDTAHSWSHQMPALAAAGYRAVAPYLRGFPPTEIPHDGFFDRGTLATDIAELIRELGAGRPVNLVGQDWGAAITYSVLAAFPELIRRAVVMAVSAPGAECQEPARPQASSPLLPLVVLSTPRTAREGSGRERFAFIDYLWEYWTSAGYRDVPPSLGQYSQPHTKAWASKIDSFDAFVFVTPEYNHGTSGALKNAIDYLYREWNDKAAGFVGYGSAGGVRAVEHLRLVMGELQVADVRAQVMLSLHTDFENFATFKPGSRHEASVNACSIRSSPGAER